MPLLNINEVQEVINAIINSGLDASDSRTALFQFIKPAFKASIPTSSVAITQLTMDIGRMNEIERFSNGDVPLQIYLQNAVLLLTGFEQEHNIVRAVLDKIMHRATGMPRLDPATLPETNEKIVFSDDMVTFGFMEAGVKAAAAVLKLYVPRFENGIARNNSKGEHMTYLGTGWLLTESLVMTNHHVINARNDNEAAALTPDFERQARTTRAQFDFDADNLAGIDTQIDSVLAWNQSLDYAILRIPATGREPLRRSTVSVEMGSDPIPVNIIQHPGGRSKRYGIRNNLVSAATATELRYFTDTESGSSGSPVFNEKWEVVALHRASTYVANVQFQGKTTAYVNLGTPLLPIIDDIKARYSELAAEIGL